MSKGTGIGMKLYYFKYPYRIEIVSGMGMRPSTGIGMRQGTGMGMRHVHSVGEAAPDVQIERGQTSSPHEGPTFFTSAGYKKLFKELVVESLQSSAGVRENILVTHIV